MFFDAQVPCFEIGQQCFSNVFKRNSDKISVSQEQKQIIWFDLKYALL